MKPLIDRVNGEVDEHTYGDTKPSFLRATPEIADKEKLMVSTIRTAQKILSDPALDDATALRRAGLTVAASINYIHPFHDGNGRAGRLTHYLVEFGTGSGQEIFQQETSAVITKISLPDQPKLTKPLYVDAPPILQNALAEHIELDDQIKGIPKETNDRVNATRRIEAYHQMVTGEITLYVNKETPAPNWTDAEMKNVAIKPGAMLFTELHERQYLASSGIPHCNGRSPELPSEIPASQINPAPAFSPAGRAAQAAQAISD